MISRDTASGLLKKLTEIDTAFDDLSNYSNSRFKGQVGSIKQYFKNTKSLLDNLGRISVAHNGNEKVGSILNRTYQESSKACKNHFDQIIKRLQFHDIIQQRLAHITELNNSLMAELLDYQSNGSLLRLSYSSLIYEIIHLYIAQLELIKEEYHLSFEEIKNNLQGLSKEISKLKEVTWDHSETAFFIDKQIMDVPDYIEECMEFEKELFQRVLNIDSEAAVVDNTVALVEGVKGLIEEFGGRKYASVNNEGEIKKVIHKLNQIFTMETERKIWYKIMSDAGFAAVLDSGIQENIQDNDIDLF